MEDLNKLISVLRDPDQAQYYHGNFLEDAASTLQSLNNTKNFYKLNSKIKAISSNLLAYSEDPESVIPATLEGLERQIEYLEDAISEFRSYTGDK